MGKKVIDFTSFLSKRGSQQPKEMSETDRILDSLLEEREKLEEYLDEEDYFDEEEYDEEDYEEDYEDEEEEDEDYDEEDDENPFGFPFSGDQEDFLSQLKSMLETMGIPPLPENPSLHDLFNVSEEEEKSWYTLHEGAYPTFADLARELEAPRDYPTVLITNGDIREACRRFPIETREFFLSKLDGQLESSSLDDTDISIFLTACHFFAEYHVEDAYPLILSWLAQTGESTRAFVGDYLHQTLPAVLYATFDGDFDYTLDVLSLDCIGRDSAKIISGAMAQIAIDGGLTPEENERYLRKYLDLVFENHQNGEAAACWIVSCGFEKTMRTELKRLLKRHISIHMYGTADPDEYAAIIREDTDRPHLILYRDILMDHAILAGMYSRALHFDPALLDWVSSQQKERIARIREMNR